MNYGALGVAIGHELMHGMDLINRYRDQNGKFIDWWRNGTELQYVQRVHCFDRQVNYDWSSNVIFSNF